MKILYILFIPLFAIYLGCGSSTDLNILSLEKVKVTKYYTTGPYEKEMKQIIDDAISEFGNTTLPENAAVVFDIDETTLNNWNYNAKYDFGYIPEFWHEWVLSAEAPAIVETKRLYDFLVDKGVHIIFLTGRKDKEYDASIKNLEKAGYTTYDTLITRSPEYYKSAAIDYKSEARAKLTEAGYVIIGSVGDQWSDLEGGNAGITVKLPNYIYFIE